MLDIVWIVKGGNFQERGHQLFMWDSGYEAFWHSNELFKVSSAHIKDYDPRIGEENYGEKHEITEKWHFKCWVLIPLSIRI